MAFTKKSKKVAIPDSIEEMYLDYTNRNIKGPVDHQTDMLRKYKENVNEENLALELPTGSGKTLVGLLIGEWRRRKFNEKVIYLCPTRQLVNQVVDQAENIYGINVTGYTGTKQAYSDDQKSRFNTNKTVSVTTYSSLFNINPFFKDIDIIIMDDSHSGDNYISDHWTVEVSSFKEAETSLFDNLVSILKNKVSSTDYYKLTNQSEETLSDMSWVEKLPGLYFDEIRDDVYVAISSYVKEYDNPSIQFSWAVIKDHLNACHLYYSKNKILIRPLIPPSLTHKEFKNAKQRIFMSATLGAGGDLERISGLANIVRLECPDKWKKRAIGRRLFFFPELYSPGISDQLNKELILKAGRSLYITSSDKDLKEKMEDFKESLPEHKIVTADQYEQDTSEFLAFDKAILFLANRYDGIDLKDDKCRLLILDKLSAGLNLQDRFLLEKLGANSNFKDRIRTKITQMVGRCTRSETDYSAVVIAGGELTDYFNKHDFRHLLHPELQAEIKFGIEQSDQDISGFKENFDIFLERGEDWKSCEEDIAIDREAAVINNIPGELDLESSVTEEINFQYLIWNNNTLAAIDSAKSILGCLKNGELRGYRAFWNYYIGSLVIRLCKEHGNSIGEEQLKYFKDSSKGAPSISWLPKIVEELSLTKETSNHENIYNFQVDNFIRVHKKIGLTHNGKFDPVVNEIFEYTSNGDSKAFENAQVKLGDLLGFQSGKKETKGAPDPWWIINENEVIVFEDHSDGTRTGVLGAVKARQAATHQNWIREHLGLKDDATVYQVLITPKVKLEEGAAVHLEGKVSYWPLDDYKQWVASAISTIREVRKVVNFYDIEDLSTISKRLEESGIHRNNIVTLLKNIIFNQS